MPRFRMTYPYARNWPDLGLSCEPNQVIERDENPDPHHFVEVAEKAPKAKPATDETTEEN